MEKSIGALWIATGNKGEYWKGNIEIEIKDEKGKPKTIKQNVIVFKNTYKKDNQPDFKIYRQKQKEEKQEEGTFVPDDTELPF